MAAIGMLPALPQEPALAQRPPVAPRSHRQVYLGSWHDVAVHDLDALAPGQRVDGPAILDATTPTVLLRANDRARVTPLGWLDIVLES